METLTPGISLSKEQLARLPQVEYKGGISIINTQEQAEIALDRLSREPVVGFDTETRPNFQKGQNHTVALVQLATADHSYLFRLNKMGFCAPLISFFENPAVKKIGLSIKDDFFNLHKLREFKPANFVDLQDVVKDYGIGEMSLQKIYAILFSQRISKSQRLSNWEADRLSSPQQNYASIDAWACLKIHNYLSRETFVAEESPYYSSPEE